MDVATLKIAAQYGIGGVIALMLVWILGRILWRIGERMIGAIDALRKAHDEGQSRIADRFEQLADRFDSHTRADVEALKSVQVSVANLDGKFDAVLDKLDRTPVHGVPVAPVQWVQPAKFDPLRWTIVTPDGAAYPIAECNACGFKAFAGDKRCAEHETKCPRRPPTEHKRGRTNG